MSHWLAGGTDSFTDIRPFLYPLLLLITDFFGGIYSSWFFQFCLWLMTVNLVFISIFKLTSNSIIAFVGALMTTVNLSFVLLTMYGLSEVTLIFLISVFIYYVVKHYHERKAPQFILFALLIASLMTVVKPLYYLLFLFLSFVIFPLSYFRIFLAKRRLFLFLLLAVSPVIIQLSVMKIRHDTFSISKISSVTLRNYYFSLLYSRINNISFEQAKKHAKDVSGREILDFTIENPKESLYTFWNTMKSNINSRCELIDRKNNPDSYRWMERLNSIYYYFHEFFFYLLLLSLILVLARYKGLILFFCLIIIPLYLVILTSGISFNQGDRLVLPALPLWIVLYIFIAQFLFYHFFKRKSASPAFQ